MTDERQVEPLPTSAMIKAGQTALNAVEHGYGYRYCYRLDDEVAAIWHAMEDARIYSSSTMVKQIANIIENEHCDSWTTAEPHSPINRPSNQQG